LVLPLDNFIFARRHRVSGKFVDHTWLIAAWIQDQDPKLDAIREAAAQILALTDYTSLAGPNSPAQVREQAKALYQALQNHGWRHDDSGLVFHKAEGHFIQRVRFPGQTLDARGGNCLEGSVLFASLLSASRLHPIILFVPGHAIVGWKDWDRTQANWEFLDMTMTGALTFEEACAEGNKKYAEVKELCEEWIQTNPTLIANAESFAIPVDIHDVWKNRRMITLPSQM